MFSKTEKSKDQSTWSLSDILSEVVLPPEHAGRIRAKQLHDVQRLSLVIMLANLVSAAVVVMSFSNKSSDFLLAIWGFAMLFVCGFGYLMQLRARERDPLRPRSEAAIDRYARSVSIAGLLWAIAPIIVLNFTDVWGQMTLGIIMSGVLFAGAFLLARVPQAAFSFTVPIAIGMVIALQMHPNSHNQFLAVLMFVYLGVLAVGIKWGHRQFVEQNINEAAVKEQSQLINLLLRDFEESTSDWLWQTNEEGVLEDLPVALSMDTNQASIGTSFIDKFVESSARTVLKTSMERRHGFNDIVVRVADDEQEIWWSITGKPIFTQGEFAGYRGVVSDVTQSKEIEDRIAYMAHYDDLTGLPNRATLHEHLEKAVRAPLSHGKEKALIWLDLDNFKWVNDTLGHPAGDELLKIVTQRVTEICNDQDVFARLSGDEFALIVERDDKGGLSTFLDDLAAYLSEPYNLWGSTARCSASLGVRVFDSYTSDASTMLKHADLALYQAKRLGKGNWSMFTSDLDDKARVRLQLESDLHRALEHNELRVHFQPLIDANTRETVACETLLRWQHPQRGMVYPGEFIEHAEDNGLITRIGDWVIRAALSEARRLPDNVRVSVNISPLQIHSSNLVSTIVNALAANNIDPSRLELEITESVLMTDTEFTLQRLHQLKEIGIRIALDDFGTGFSSLSYLRSFPFDKIKIDKCFVSDLESSEDSRAITMATLGLAKSLGMRCTAEGVENEFQSEFLRKHGCDELQGYLISRAQTLDNLRHLVDVADNDRAPRAPQIEMTPVKAAKKFKKASR